MTLADILAVAEGNNLDEILGTIYDVYLSPREKTLYNMLSLSVNGKPQRQLSILFYMHQDKVSVYLARLRKKLRRIYYTLTTHSEELKDLKVCLEISLTDKQLLIVEQLLMGQKNIRIARQLRCSPAYITKTIARVYTKLPVDRMLQLEQFINDLR